VRAAPHLGALGGPERGGRGRAREQPAVEIDHQVGSRLVADPPEMVEGEEPGADETD